MDDKERATEVGKILKRYLIDDDTIRKKQLERAWMSKKAPSSTQGLSTGRSVQRKPSSKIPNKKSKAMNKIKSMRLLAGFA